MAGADGVIRREIRLPGRRRRLLAERLVLRAPGLVFRLASAIQGGRMARSPLSTSLVAWGMQSQFDALNRRDYELFLLRCDPDLVVDATGVGEPELRLDFESEYHGHAGLLRFFDRWFGGWDEYRVEVDEMLTRDGARFALTGRQLARGHASGAEIERPVGFVVTLENARATRIQLFWDPEAARRELAA